MKTLGPIFLVLIAATSTFATTPQQPLPTTVLDCKAQIVIDEEETLNVGMQVLQTADGKYFSYLKGSSLPEDVPQETDFLTLLPEEALKINGVLQVLSKTSLTRDDYQKLDHVMIYTTGNFDDDAAGVRGVAFMDTTGNLKASGMFFGWGGPHACQDE